EVVLLLQPGVLQQLRRDRAVLREALLWNRVRDDDLRRSTAPELVLQPGPLVVERRRARDAEPACRHRQLVRAVRQRDVEPSVAGPAPQRAEPRLHLPPLAER